MTWCVLLKRHMICIRHGLNLDYIGFRMLDMHPVLVLLSREMGLLTL